MKTPPPPRNLVIIHCVVAFFLATALIGHAQTNPTAPAFDVASIHHTPSGQLNGFIKPLPGGHGYVSQNISVKLMISLMYKVPMRQIEAAPDWLATERYDIEARSENPTSIDDIHTMFQTLLADRFNLHFHWQTREGPVYALVVDKSGPRMKPNNSPEDFAIPMNFSPDGRAVGKRVPMPYLTWWLGQQLQADERPVIDQTGLTGNYDFTLLFAPVRPPGSPDLSDELRDRPSLFEAVQQQLGLRLVPQKGPVPWFIIDHIEKPSAN